MNRAKSIIFIAVVVLAIAAGLYFGAWEKQSGVLGPRTAVGETYVNARGEKWGPLPDKSEFTVSSPQGKYPQFVSGAINPVKVYPGDTQYMKVTVMGDAPITSVIAEIETDNGVREVPPKNPREYTWSVKEISANIQVLATDVWGSSPKDVYVTCLSGGTRGYKLFHYDGAQVGGRENKKQHGL